MKVIFAGPSIYPGEAVRASSPDVIWRGPAQQGDVAKAVQDGATAIGLIDGLYGVVAAVWHKEILFALSSGVQVVGGASMGALRAVECDHFGMEGLGSVFQAYLDGELVDDGDVALLHAPPEMDYAPMTETLVDLRATLRDLEVSGQIEADVKSAIVAAAEKTFFWERTMDVVLAAASIVGDEAVALERLIERHRVGIKKRDAMLVFDRVSALPACRVDPPAWSVSKTRAYHRSVGG